MISKLFYDFVLNVKLVFPRLLTFWINELYILVNVSFPFYHCLRGEEKVSKFQLEFLVNVWWRM